MVDARTALLTVLTDLMLLIVQERGHLDLAEP